MLRHIVKAQQFDKPWIEGFFGQVREMEDVAASGGSDALRRRIMATLFYQPSTRTRLSFEAAMCRLGGTVISTENAKEFSSAAKGESLEDTIRVVAGYADVIVLRHYELGSSERAAALDAAPIINAGDGPGQHPTQALLDLYTIERELGRLEGLNVAVVGDLKYGRTVRSLAYLLSKFSGTKLYFVAPPICQIGEDIKAHLAEKNVPFEEIGALEDVIGEVDVVYQTRIQRERFATPEEYEACRGVYVVDRAAMARLNPAAVLLHPLPRVDEIAPEVDADPRAAYFRQARNGVFLRMALLHELLAVGDQPSAVGG